MSQTSNAAAASNPASSTTENATENTSRVRVYYARSVLLRGTEQERADIASLEKAGFEVVNAEREEVDCDDWDKDAGFVYFNKTSNVAANKRPAVLVYRPYDDGSIPNGIATLIKAVRFHGFLIMELPTASNRPTMRWQETVEYLSAAGYN